MDKASLVVGLSIILSASIVGGQDIHYEWGEDSLMPGIRTFREREAGPTNPPLIDSPIFFPGEVSEEPAAHREEPVGAPSDETLELPLDFSELDINVLSRINSLSNITDFAQLFDLELPPSKPSFDFGSFEIGGRIGESAMDEGETLPMANCKPELVTVPLDLPVEASTMFFPTCVRLERCGGCCYGPLLTCRPTVTKAIKVKVLKVSTSSSVSSVSSDIGSGRGSRRRRRQNQQSYHQVEVVKHTACECGCKVREDDCNSALHVYYEGECACKCKNKDEQTKCKQQNTTKYWDNNSCNCFCRRRPDCGTGENFSEVTCSCERLAARHGSISGDEGTEA